MNRVFLTRIFLFLLLAGVLFGCFLVFKPFLVIITVSAVLSSVFYPAYEWLVKKTGGRPRLSGVIMCLLITLCIIIPLTNLIVFGAQKSIDAYSDTMKFLNGNGIENTLSQGFMVKISDKLSLSGLDFKPMFLDVAQKSSNWLVGGATSLVKGTTSFVISLILIIFSLFFFFVDGKRMLDKLMYWTPLPDKYDHRIFKKFKDVSYSLFFSTFAVALAQATLCAIGFSVVGLPAFFPAIATALLSMIPYFGAYVVWVPASIYLLATGQIWQGIFIALWGAGIISTVDNLIRMFVIKGKAQVHPLFILFSVLGGITVFGFWGVIIGPMLIALTVTVLDIYDEIEYKKILCK
jgi:predicted PurR-regulated permease PerM